MARVKIVSAHVNNARAFIIVSNKVNSIPVLEFCSRDLFTVRLIGAGTGRTLLITSSYLLYDDVDSLKKRVRALESKNLGYLGDHEALALYNCK
ncbi:hypothetical protein J6590_103565, partial [Homalodisca vitripennis]